MTLFFFKPKPVEVIAYIDNPLLYENYRIDSASRHLPSYYREISSRAKVKNPHPVDNSLNYFSTIKRCYGINQFNLAGFVVPLWSDYSILLNNDTITARGASCTPQRQSYTIHDPKEFEGALNNIHAIKLMSPWALDCKEDVKFMYMQNYYAVNSPIWSIPTGIVNYKLQNSTHIFMLIKKGLPNQEIFLNAGTPLTKIVPLTERPVNIRCELVEDVQKIKKTPMKIYFSNVVNKLVKHSNKQKCPFDKG